MRNTSKMTTLENKFPLLAVEHGCIISKDADITVAFEVELPELYTVTGAEYEAIHGCWCKAIKVLPDFCVVHKQDWFIKERYKPELQKDDMSFLSRSFERHFNERPYLKHSCYLYLTKTTKERNRMQSNFSTLCRGHIIPKELDKETAGKFMEAAEQFERIMNDSGFVRLRRLSTDELVGTEKSAGLIERYFSLMPEGDTTLQDIDLSAKEMRIGDNRLCLHTLSDAEDMPGKVATDIRYEKLSTDRSDCRLSFASAGMDQFLAGAGSLKLVFTIIACCSIVITAVYILRVVGKLLFGPVYDEHHLSLTDATWWERLSTVTLILCVAAIGCFPNFFNHLINTTFTPAIFKVLGM